MISRRRIILTGATGLIGSALSKRLTSLGFEVVPFRSRHAGPGGFDHVSEGIKMGLFTHFRKLPAIRSSWKYCRAVSRARHSPKTGPAPDIKGYARARSKPQVSSRYAIHDRCI